MSVLLQQALNASVQLARYPKSELSVTVLVLQDDGGKRRWQRLQLQCGGLSLLSPRLVCWHKPQAPLLPPFRAHPLPSQTQTWSYLTL